MEGNRTAGAAPSTWGAVGYQGAGADPVARFRDEFTAAGGFVHVVADAVAAGEVVATLCCESVPFAASCSAAAPSLIRLTYRSD